MNKVYNTFDKITVSDELKEKTYQRIIENNKIVHSRKINIFRLSLAITSIILCLFIYSINDNNDNALSNYTEIDTFNATDASIKESNYITYNNKKYILDNSIVIEENMLDEKIGDIDQREISTNTESNLQDSASIYSIKNIDKELQLAVLTDNEILVFIVEE